VRFLGRRADVPAILAASDALVLPSLANECLPFAILEAMSAGLPVVGTDVAGIPEEIADGETGYVVPPGDADALAAAIGRLADDPARARAMGEAGRRRAAAEFAVDRMVEQVTEIWRPRELLRRR
jgi:glycosyltransferase involved in cell wall biosynthesis